MVVMGDVPQEGDKVRKTEFLGHFGVEFDLVDPELTSNVVRMHEVAADDEGVGWCVHAVDPSRRDDESVSRLQFDLGVARWLSRCTALIKRKMLRCPLTL